MKKLLKDISINAIKCNPDFFTENEKNTQWIGKKTASIAVIEAAEQRLGIKLPSDYVEFLKISNGTSQFLNQTFSGFLPVENIDWLKNIEKETLENYAEMGKNYIENLENSIIVAGVGHVHQILLIQPFGENKHWQYWQFASYFPGERPFEGIKKYLVQINDFLKEQNQDVQLI